MTLLFLSLAIVRGFASSDAALAHLGAANQLLEQERYSEAATEYQLALDGNPKLSAARRDLAICRFQTREYEASKKLVSELLRDPSTRGMAHYYLGRIDLIQGKFASAIGQLLLIPISQPFRDERYFLGMAYFKSGAWQDSVKALQGYIDESPRDFRSHQLLARALQKLGREEVAAREFDQTRQWLGYYTEGSQALKRCGDVLSTQNADGIVRDCDSLFETDDVDKLAALGLLLGKAGSFEKAKAAWSRAAFLDPESPEIRYDLAVTCFHLKDRVCARDNAAAAIQARTDFPEANILYASVLYTMGADADALPALRKAHALVPNDSSVRELLANELVLWAEQYVKSTKASAALLLLSELDQLQPLQPEQQRRAVDLRGQLAISH